MEVQDSDTNVPEPAEASQTVDVDVPFLESELYAKFLRIKEAIFADISPECN